VWQRIETKKTAYFDIREPATGARGLFTLIWALTQCSYRVYLRHRPRFIAKLGSHTGLILQLPGVVLTRTGPAEWKPALCFADRRIDYPASMVVDWDWFHPLETATMRLPLGMHPMSYLRGLEESTRCSSQEKSTRYRVFFAGNADPDKYAHARIPRLWGQLTRLDCLDAVRDQTAGERVFSPENPQGLSRQNLDSKVVLCDSPDARLELPDYLGALTRADFALCPSGVGYPASHNSIEAMCAGAVPILEYADFFDPPLEDGENCLAFSGRAELGEKLELALAMERDRVARMRRNVLDYYDRYLSPEGIVNHIENGEGLRRLYVNCGGKSLSAFRQRLAETRTGDGEGGGR
jgi:hypothetical protein